MNATSDRLRRFRDSRSAVAITMALIIAVCTNQAARLGWLERWELYVYDAFEELLAPRAAADEDVVMVWIGDADYRIHGHPLPDAVVATVLERILEHEPRAVGVDIYRDVAVGEGKEKLRRVVLDHPEVVLVEKLSGPNSSGVRAPSFASSASQVGFADLVRDADGVTRRGFLYFWESDGTPRLSLSLQLALRFLARESIELAQSPLHSDWVALGDTTIAPLDADFGGYAGIADGGYQILIDYGRGPGEVPGIKLAEILAGQVDRSRIHDRVVILGTAALSVKDYFESPSGGRLGGTQRGADRSITGAEIHGKLVTQLIRWGRGEAQPVRGLKPGGEAAVIALFALAGTAGGIVGGSVLGIALRAIFGLALIAITALLGFANGWWLPVASPVLAAFASFGLGVVYVSQRERREKAQIMQLFGRFLSRRLATQLWDRRSEFMRGGQPVSQRATVTILMSDVAGYTTACEKLEPDEVMRWVGALMDALAHEIEEHGAIVNDFVGDGVMATFGAPIPAETEAEADRDAEAAVRCALAIVRRLGELNERWRTEGLPQARMRMGVLTGPAVLGAVGSVERSKYATVGDVVNTAARLVEFDKEGFLAEPESRFRLLLGAETWRRIEGRFEGECVGPTILRGRAEPVTIYRVRGFSGVSAD